MDNGPFAAPGTDASAIQTERARGGCLTALLVLMLILNPLVAAMYLLAGGMIAETLPGAPGWAIPVLGLGALANTGGAVAIWNWKRWGLALCVGAAAVALVVNVIIGVPPNQLVSGLLGPAILGGLMYSRWEMFD